MLPLWIIDLTQSSDRRARLVELLRQTDYVFFSRHEDNPDLDVTDGEYRWLYTHYELSEDRQLPFDLSECADEDLQANCDRIYRFQNDMVRDGQEYVRMIRHSSLHAYTTLNICVLGDATEPLSQSYFSSIALFLQKEKGRMLANHVHQGMSVYGALFVPSSINSDNVENRERVLRALMEVDVQHQLTTVRGYDHVLLFQDVQNRVEKYYHLLDEKGQAEYFYQCLVHLYYACNTQHPLLSGVAAADSFYLSIGAASVFFDDSRQDIGVSCKVGNRLLERFYAPAENDEAFDDPENRKARREFFSDDEIKIDRVLQTFRLDRIELNVVLPDTFPDPITNFNNKQLKRRYYKNALTNRLAEFRRLMNDEVEKATRDKLELVHSTFNRSLNVLQEVRFPDGIRRFVERCNSTDGGLCLLEAQLKNLKEDAGEKKKRAFDYVEGHVWENAFQNIPTSVSEAFHNYHAAYLQDTQSKAVGHYCDDLKNAAIDDLCNHLKKETPLLSRIIRAFLLGLVCILLVLPVLNLISPLLVNLGNIRKTAAIWSTIIFVIPALCELVMLIRYLIKRERKERKLRAYYLHDAYARVANRVLTEADNYYNQVINLCDLYLQRSETIRREINDLPSLKMNREELPETQFNQPLVGGSFNGHPLLTEEHLEPKMILINHVKKEVEKLYPDDYFSLIHLFKEDFQGLFAGIRIPEEHPFIVDKATGTVRLLTPEEVKETVAKEWEEKRDSFVDRLPELIEEELVPLKNPTASEMLEQYLKRFRNQSILTPFISYAATNGEFTTAADNEVVDVKTIDDKLEEKLAYRFPVSINFQTEPGGDDDESQEAHKLYRKYLFLTRWIGYDNLALNRILPLEDFDIEEQKRQVNEEERDKNEDDYPIATSSTILWSLCQGDNSILWLNLFHALALVKAREKSAAIFKKLTTKD